MNNSRYHTAGLRVLPHECAVIILSVFLEIIGKRKLSGWKPFRGTGAEKRAGYAVKTYEEVTVYMGIFRCDGGTAARTKS